MAPKRVLILSRHRLLDSGLQIALGKQPGIEIVGVCRESEDLYSQALLLRPDVLLIIDGGESVLDSAFPVLEDICTHIINITIAGRGMQVYHREQVVEAELEDLIVALRQVSNHNT